MKGGIVKQAKLVLVKLVWLLKWAVLIVEKVIYYATIALPIMRKALQRLEDYLGSL